MKKQTKKALHLTLFLMIFGALAQAQSNLCSAYPNWASNTTYYTNDKVIYNGTIYTARWYVQNTAPDKPGNAVWKDNGACILVNQDPMVSIDSPIDNDGYASGSTINITATASDNDGSIDSVFFYVNNNLVGIDIYAPYNFTWMGAADGTYQITAKAKDNNGALSASSVVTISISGLTSSNTKLVDVAKAYPNPSNGILYVNVQNMEFQQLTLSNLLGETIIEGNVNIGMNTINLSNYCNGAYYLTLTGSNSIVTQKILLNK